MIACAERRRNSEKRPAFSKRAICFMSVKFLCEKYFLSKIIATRGVSGVDNKPCVFENVFDANRKSAMLSKFVSVRKDKWQGFKV